MIMTLADGSLTDLRALVIDALHRDRVELAAIGARLSTVGPIPGHRQLARVVHDLADREVESVFHDLVLDELSRRGYRPGRAPVRVVTPDGRGVHPDIPLPTGASRSNSRVIDSTGRERSGRRIVGRRASMRAAAGS